MPPRIPPGAYAPGWPGHRPSVTSPASARRRGSITRSRPSASCGSSPARRPAGCACRAGGGVLVTPEDPAELAQALRELLENHQRRAELARHGFEAVRERFHAAVMAQNTLRVYENYL